MQAKEIVPVAIYRGGAIRPFESDAIQVRKK
jgi:hypothetical protein